MKAIEITSYGAPEVLRLGERPAPVDGAGEVLIRVQRQRREPPRRAAAQGPLPGAAGRLRHAGPGSGRRDRLRRCPGHAPRPASSWATASARWWPAAAMPSCAWRPLASACRCPRASATSRRLRLPETFFTVWSNVFERARLQPGENPADPGRLERHRRHGHPDRQGHGRHGDGHGRQRRQVRGLHRPGGRPRHQLQAPATSPKR